MALTRQRVTVNNGPAETTCSNGSAKYASQDSPFNEALKASLIAVQAVRPSTKFDLTPKRKRLSKTSKWPTSQNVVPSPKHEMAPHAAITSVTSQCPFLTPEFHKIQARHRTLASTGCTAQFCQAGRMLHTDEPRIGENRALKVVEQEARDFLEELRLEKFFDSDEAFCERLRAVLREVRAGATDGIIRQDKRRGEVGGNWSQTPAELEFGLRRAWRNSRKCIMRSHCDELKLCDLRAITTSTAMATELIKGVSEAFNGGNIQPTVFVFPPRKADSRGPMIWNNQILAFAGYEVEDGSILGDPMSKELTKAIIELGWKPPESRSKWDLLPIVAMADGDVPVIAELPSELRKLVEIRHPQYGKEFERLDLKWVAFPALTRLGFDIGGVQYTATPFIGWFMDAEIGVRNLADSFRYNALPDIIEALGLASGKIGEIAESFEDLPEFERLQMLSRAQSELNYAVHWSFSQANVSMSDSLSASMKWSRYDDEFKEKNGFRLPADPYWLAPPQGSIIPLWHRGGAPNYQPKPMICKHVQDPLKAWAREKPDWFVSAKELHVAASLPPIRPNNLLQSLSLDYGYLNPPERLKHAVSTILDEKFTDAIVEEILPRTASLSIEVYFCSAGTLAEKIATKLHDRTKSLVSNVGGIDVSASAAPLNALGSSSITVNKIFLLVVSSTGQGDVPANGIHFIERCQDMIAKNVNSVHFRFAIYGNGDTRYSGTYNGAAKKIQLLFRGLGGISIAGGLFDGDTALQSTAFQALNPWWKKLRPAIQDLLEDPCKLEHTEGQVAEQTNDGGVDNEESLEVFRKHSQQLNSQYRDTTLISISQTIQPSHVGSHLVSFDIGNESYEDLGCIQLLPVNSRSKIRRVLRVLDVGASELVELYSQPEQCPSYSKFLSEFVDLEAPFTNLRWLNKIAVTIAGDLDDLKPLSVLEVLDVLQKQSPTTDLTTKLNVPSDSYPSLRTAICLAMPILLPRNYSIASSNSYLSQQHCLEPPLPSTTPRPARKIQAPALPLRTQLQILIKPQPNGRFSSTFLSDNPAPTALKYRLVDSPSGPRLRTPHSTPLIIIATGAGFAPVRCLLQRHILAARSASRSSLPSATYQLQEGKISLYLGLKPVDLPLVTDLLMEAARWGVLDVMSIVPSNEGKARIYEKLEEEGVGEGVRRKIVDEGGRVFVCAGVEAARGVRQVLGRIVGGDRGGDEGGDIRRLMGERYVEEIF